MTLLAAASTTDWSQHAFWLASRAAGVVAMVLMTVTVIVGLAQGGNLLGGFSKKLRTRTGTQARDLTRMHEFLSLGAIVMLLAHGLLLLGDPWLSPSLAQIAIPFKLDYRTFYTGLGVTAGWIALLLGLTYYLRSHIGVKRWKTIHRFTIVGYALSVVHVLGAGSDASSEWLRTPMLASAGLVAVMFLLRVTAGRATAKDRAAASRPMPRSPRPALPRW